MTRRLHLWDEADLDVLDAVAWYEDQRAGLGAELLIELDAVMQRMVQTPLQFPQIKENVRRALLHRFPYSVYFKVGDETVDVVAVLHQHHDPRTLGAENPGIDKLANTTLIGIGAAVTRRPLPHHRAYGSVHGGSRRLG